VFCKGALSQPLRVVVVGPGRRSFEDDVPAEAAVIASAVEALGPNKALACRIIGGFPHGHTFVAPVTLAVPLSNEASAGALTCLYRADDAAPWTPLPPGVDVSREGE
jgi:hypothetical protein